MKGGGAIFASRAWRCRSERTWGSSPPASKSGLSRVNDGTSGNFQLGSFTAVVLSIAEMELWPLWRESIESDTAEGAARRRKWRIATRTNNDLSVLHVFTRAGGIFLPKALWEAVMTQVHPTRSQPGSTRVRPVTGQHFSTRVIGSSDLRVFPLALSGNIFGWTADDAATSSIFEHVRRWRRQLHRHGRLVCLRSKRAHDRQVDAHSPQSRPDRGRYQGGQEPRQSRHGCGGDQAVGGCLARALGHIPH